MRQCQTPSRSVLATKHEFHAMLTMLDAAVAWLVARGGEGQWGKEPLSMNGAMVEYLSHIITLGELRVAQNSTGRVVGGYVLGGRPNYAPSISEPERYIEAMVTDRRFAGNGIGGLLVADAVLRARAVGATRLRTDCWSGSARLVRWWEEQGFNRGATVLVGDWPAQLLDMPI
jgi:GNAT superfamily N-acetyltransferase